MATSKKSMWAYIEATAKRFGFTVAENSFGKYIEDETHTVNITVHEHWDFNRENRTVTYRHTISASIATMGGNPTGDELKMRGDRIIKAGQMVNTFAEFPLSLTYTEEFERVPKTTEETESMEETENMEEGTIIESYKITVRGSIRIRRRETRRGADSLADKLQSDGKHGTVEAVVSMPDADGVELRLIRTF